MTEMNTTAATSEPAGTEAPETAAVEAAQAKAKPNKHKTRKPKHQSIDMLRGPLVSKILLFAIPLALTSILQQLLNSADASIAGRFVSSASLAGIGGVAPITATFVNFFVGLSVGANVIVAMRIGSNETHLIKEAVHTAMAFSLVLGIALMALGLVLTDWVLGAIAMPPDAQADAAVYIRFYFCAIPLLTIYNFGSAVLRARGDVRRPLFALTVAVIINLALDLLFVCVFEWGTAGIGAATIIASVISALMVVIFLVREEDPFKLYLREIGFSASSLKWILRIGVPAGIQSAVFSLSNTVVQSAINSYGSAAIAGSAATLNYEYYTFAFVNAFAQTAVTFTSQNFAAQNVERCKKIFRWCLLFGFSSALILGITFTALGHTALSVFTTDAAAFGYGMMRMYFIELLDCMTSLYEVPAGAMRGMGWSTLPAIVTIVGSCVLRIVFVIWIYPSFNTFLSLMVLYPVSWSFMIVVMVPAYILVSRKMYRKVESRRAEAAQRKAQPQEAMAH